MKKLRENPEVGQVLAVPLSQGRWVYTASLAGCDMLYRIVSKGLIRDDFLFSKKEWYAPFKAPRWTTNCLVVGTFPNTPQDSPKFVFREPDSSRIVDPFIYFDGDSCFYVNKESASKLPSIQEFKKIYQFREWLEAISHDFPLLMGDPAENPKPPGPMLVEFEIRNLIPVGERPKTVPHVEKSYHQLVAEIEWGVGETRKETESLVEYLKEEIRDEEYEALVTGCCPLEGKVTVKCTTKDAKALLTNLRQHYGLDGIDHRRYSYLTIELRGPAPNEVKVFGTKGPAKFVSGVETVKEKDPVFDADGRDAGTFFPITLEDQRMEKDSPEVRLEFDDSDGLDETADLEDGLA